ncbi:hypothetical protein C8R47DRAFT_403140 [Mycena vitilis]|nr:hypothetical protein C8R47DRAFT_403140 [Mycena vitilis]
MSKLCHFTSSPPGCYLPTVALYFDFVSADWLPPPPQDGIGVFFPVVVAVFSRVWLSNSLHPGPGTVHVCRLIRRSLNHWCPTRGHRPQQASCCGGSSESRLNCGGVKLLRIYCLKTTTNSARGSQGMNQSIYITCEWRNIQHALKKGKSIAVPSQRIVELLRLRFSARTNK